MATTRTSSKTKPDALPFPKLIGHSEQQVFWLAAWIRDQSAFEALETLAYSDKISATKNPALFHGLCLAMQAAKRDAKDSLNFLWGMGGLLYAWHGTTALDTGVPA